jgi:hypothetical protein
MGRLTRGSEGREERRERRSTPGGGAPATFTGVAVLRAGEKEGEWCGWCGGWCCPYIGYKGGEGRSAWRWGAGIPAAALLPSVELSGRRGGAVSVEGKGPRRRWVSGAPFMAEWRERRGRAGAGCGGEGRQRRGEEKGGRRREEGGGADG